ncbi:MAG: Gluconate 2-dehydrogenase flavoprotein [Aeromicrobium sp.]|nr:Gluconate 2-dehydrogenase flavoprotein [Aeromicrobium sp.]
MEQHTDEAADVVIVGGGTAAGIVAHELSTAGFSVVVLEQGRWTDTALLPGNTPEYEVAGAALWHPDPNVRGKPEDYPLDTSQSDLPVWLYNGVGGSSVLYGGIWARALPSDFSVRSLDGVADDWPLTYRELVPFYEAVEKEMGVAGLAGNPAYPPGSGPPLPPAPIHIPGRKMAEGMNRLGWHWWPGTNAIATQAYRHQSQCVRYGVCRMGCPQGAKASVDITHLPQAVANGVRLITGARVAEIPLDRRGRATGAVYMKDGHQYLQRASVVVMAAGGIGTPRVLLMSESARFPDGLANTSGLVGKRLMLHPYGSAVGVYDDDLEDWLGPAGEYISSMQFYESEPDRGFVRGAKWSLLPIAGPLEAVHKWERHGSVDQRDFWGAGSAQRMKSLIGHMMQWHVVPEDLPEESNRVELHPTLTDSDGLPAAAIRYRVSDNTERIVEFNLARALEAHEAAGATQSWVAGRRLSTGHNTGTAKMGVDPETSVTDSYGKAHNVPNLYVVDGSVFPTSTGVNVTATICALAKRTARHMIEGAAAQEVSA